MFLVLGQETHVAEDCWAGGNGFSYQLRLGKGKKSMVQKSCIEAEFRRRRPTSSSRSLDYFNGASEILGGNPEAFKEVSWISPLTLGRFCNSYTSILYLSNRQVGCSLTTKDNSQLLRYPSLYKDFILNIKSLYKFYLSL